MPGYIVLDFESSIQYDEVQVPLKGKNNKGKFKTVRREALHGPSWKSPKNDIYSIIYGDHPDRINMLHSKRGFKRKLPFRVGKMLLKSHTMIGTNLKFDLGYIWHDKYFQKWLANGGKIWDCFRGDTEILTEEGFQRFDELDKTIKVAQYSEDGAISFVRPIAYIENHFDGELVHIHGPKGVNHISTPNHNRVIRKQKKLDKISLVTADSTSALAKGNKSVISGVLNNEQECDFTDDELRFIVAIQADAHINKQGYASFELSKPRKQERLEDILKSIGLDYKLYTYRNKIYHVRGIDKYLGENKHFDIIDPLKMSLRQRLLFINELNFWDGEPKYCNKKGMIYHNLNEQALDKVRLLCALSKCRVHKSKNGKSLWITRDCDDLQNSMISKSYIKHTGKVYCVNVPSNMIIIRQGKDIQVSGNCQIAAYLLGGQRWQYPSLGEMQSVILGRKTKLDSITKLFKRMIGANEIIARRNERKFWWKAFEYYGNEDGRSPMLIMQKQHKEAKAKGMLPVIELYNQYLLALTMMEVNGIPVDIPAVEKLYQEFSLEVVKYLEKATLIVKPFWTDPDLPALNINSPAQSSLLLFGGDIKVKRKVATGEFVKSGKNKGKEKIKTIQETVHIKGFSLDGNKFSRGTAIAGRYSTDKGVIENIYKKCADENVIEYCKNLKLSATYKQKINTYLNALLFKSVDGTIRANYNNTETRTSRLSASSPNCVSRDTEVLTTNGWERIDSITLSTAIYQVDPVTQRGSFTNPLHIISAHHNTMININSEWGNFLYSPEHRIISYTRDENIKIELAKEWYDKWQGSSIIDRKILRSSITTSTLELGPKELIVLELAVMCQAEGYLSKSGNYYNIRLKSKRKQEQAKLIWKDWHYELNGRLALNIPAQLINYWLDGTKIKNFNKNILNYGVNTLNHFYAFIHKWDGDFTRCSTYGQHIYRRASLDIVQAVAAMIGKSTKYYRHPSKPFEGINFHKKATRYQSETHISMQYYNDLAYCVTVPSGAFLIRRNGAVLVTGNCQNIPSHGEFGASIPKLLIAPPGWTCVSIDFSQLEVLCQAMLSQDWNLCRDIQKGVDFHVKRLNYIEQEFSYEELLTLCKKKLPDYINYVANKLNLPKEDYKVIKYANEIYNRAPWEEKRFKAKTISFQKAYGAAPESLAKITELPLELVKQIFEKEDIEYPQVKEFDENLAKEVQRSAILSRKYHYAAKSTKGKDRKGVPRKFSGDVELLPIRERDKKTYSFDFQEYRHVGFYVSPTGKRYSFLEYGSRKQDGSVFRYYKPTQMKNYAMQGSAGDIQAITTVAMFQLLLKHHDKVKLVNEIHDSKWFLIKNEYLDRIVSKLCGIMRSTSKLLKQRFNIDVDFDFDVEAKTGSNFADMEVYKE